MLAIKVFLTVIIVLYPILIYVGISYFEARVFGASLILIGILNFAVLQKLKEQAFIFFIVAVFVGLIVLASNSLEHLRLYPVFVNLAMFSLFTLSLYRPPTIIERFARLRAPNLTARGVLYTRKVTILWCGFFFFNMALALYTATHSSFEIWALYNGFIAYILIGLIFVGEYIVRIQHQKKDVL